MSILVGSETRLVVQGLTGREGGFHASHMAAYGTKIVAGVTPGRGGERALDQGVPVFDTVRDAVRETGANTSCIFVPASGAADAIAEAAEAGVKTIFCITEGIPVRDMVKVYEYLQRMGNACAGCRFDPAKATGDDACPFTTLYWDFLLRHEKVLRANQRMALQVKNVDRLNAAQRADIRARAASIREGGGEPPASGGELPLTAAGAGRKVRR